MKLISINLEYDRHLDRVIPFLKEQRPDVVCAQEMPEKHVALFETELRMRSVYASMGWWEAAPGTQAKRGIAIFSKTPFTGVQKECYSKNNTPADNFGDRILLSGEIDLGGKIYRVVTTHFTWTQHARQPSELQRGDLKKMLEVLSGFPDFVLCGDFNTHRGGPLFDEIASKYKDNIPTKYTNSLDGKLHPAAHLDLMVDGLFTTPEYRASNVSLEEGVSDHRAIVADIEKL